MRAARGLGVDPETMVTVTCGATEAMATAMEALPASFHADLAARYRRRRDLLCGALVRAGFRLRPPEGAYYVLCDNAALSDLADAELARRLVRFAFCKTDDVLAEAARRLESLGR